MSAAVQRDKGKCEGCGGKTRISPTSHPHQFAWRCTRCEGAGVISWYHGAEPPTFERTAVDGQALLF